MQEVVQTDPKTLKTLKVDGDAGEGMGLRVQNLGLSCGVSVVSTSPWRKPAARACWMPQQHRPSLQAAEPTRAFLAFSV